MRLWLLFTLCFSMSEWQDSCDWGYAQVSTTSALSQFRPPVLPLGHERSLGLKGSCAKESLC